jgi:hypothetical protein
MELGRDTRIEIPLTGRWRPLGLDDPFDEVEAFCKAAVAGNVVETLWRVNDIIVKSEAVIRFPGREIRPQARHLGSGNPQHAQTATIKYQGYEAPTALNSAVGGGPDLKF